MKIRTHWLLYDFVNNRMVSSLKPGYFNHCVVGLTDFYQILMYFILLNHYYETATVLELTEESE